MILYGCRKGSLQWRLFYAEMKFTAFFKLCNADRNRRIIAMSIMNYDAL